MGQLVTGEVAQLDVHVLLLHKLEAADAPVSRIKLTRRFDPNHHPPAKALGPDSNEWPHSPVAE